MESMASTVENAAVCSICNVRRVSCLRPLSCFLPRKDVVVASMESTAENSFPSFVCNTPSCVLSAPSSLTSATQAWGVWARRFRPTCGSRGTVARRARARATGALRAQGWTPSSISRRK
eukprot:283321-Rhodomonas_salina.1